MSNLSINGEQCSLPCDPRTTLLDFLHQELHLFGTKKGCDHGQCGACTVIVDGERIISCLTLAFQLSGKDVKTIEGIGQNGQLHPIQQAFIDNDAYQCGYCTSGQICSAVSLIDEKSRNEPSIVSCSSTTSSDEDIRERMSGNLCRCGAYPNIVKAVNQVIAQEKV